MNLSDLAKRAGIDEEEFVELLVIFIETSMSDLEKLQSAIKAGSTAEVIDFAHSLKGSAINFGMMEFYETARELEKNARDDRLAEATEDAHALRSMLETIANLIER